MAKQRIGAAMKTAFPVSATWFGALFGPSLLSGAYATAYFLPYGAWAIILPFVTFTVICLFAGLGANIVRLHHTYDYGSFAKVLYGRFYRYLMPLLDYDMLMAMCLGGASCIATITLLMESRFGIPPMVTAVVFSAVALVIAVYGEQAVRSFSSVMTLVMMVAFVLFAGILIFYGADRLGPAFNHWTPYEDRTVAVGIKNAILLGLSNFGVVGGTLCAVEQNVTTGKECVLIGVLSYGMNSVLMAIGALMLLPYCPEMVGVATPTVLIMEKYIAESSPLINTVYFLLMIMALITSAVPQVHAVVSRVRIMRERSGKNQPDRKAGGTAVIGAVYFLICILLSFLGLITIVSKGYTFSAYLHIGLLAIPILLWYLRRNITGRSGDGNEGDNIRNKP